jgi:hypothetical protein
MGKKEKVCIVGPLPPPLGGVAVMNQLVQKVMSERYKVVV